MKHLLKYTWAVIAFVLLSTSVFSAPLMIKCKFPTFASTSKSGAYPLNLKLDSTQSSFYANLAMAYYYQDSFEIACAKIKKAESLGLEIIDFKLLRVIKQEHCE